VRIDLDPADEFFLSGGEDHALVATLPGDAHVPTGCRVIGRVLEGDPVVTVAGEPAAGGWDHFA
jgi:thiamine-monophosphate kinase